MRVVFGFVLCLLVLAIGGLAYIYSGAYDIAADSTGSALVEWVAKTTRENAVEARAEEVQAPAEFNEAQVPAGARMFGETCVMCHGGPGVEASEVGKGLKPDPPDLSEEAAEKEPAEIFWVVKHGIRMTGMPAFGITHDDDSIWNVVAFVKRLPGMSPDTFRRMAGIPEASSPH